MNKATLALIGLTFVSHDAPSPTDVDALQLKEEEMVLEYSATLNEAAILMAAESEESLGSVEVYAPDGTSVLRVQSSGGRKLALSGYKIESQEMDLAELCASYAQGTYHIRARTADGRIARGTAALSHVIPPPAVVLFPVEGTLDLPTSGLVIRWKPDVEAAGYQLHLEQNENDGLSVELPPGSDHFVVPDGILRPNTKTQVEVAVIGENGNRTLVELSCATK